MLELIDKFDKIAEHRVNIQNQLYFYTLGIYSLKTKVGKKENISIYNSIKKN